MHSISSLADSRSEGPRAGRTIQPSTVSRQALRSTAISAFGRLAKDDPALAGTLDRALQRSGSHGTVCRPGCTVRQLKLKKALPGARGPARPRPPRLWRLPRDMLEGTIKELKEAGNKPEGSTPRRRRPRRSPSWKSSRRARAQGQRADESNRRAQSRSEPKQAGLEQLRPVPRRPRAGRIETVSLPANVSGFLAEQGCL